MKLRSPGSMVALAVAGLLAFDAVPMLAADEPIPTPASPVCTHGEPPTWVTDASHPNDGVPDPEGRLVFGLFLREDELLGQLVTLFAIDPDGSDLVQLLDCEAARPRFSPDGTRLALAIATDDGHIQIATMAPDGSDLHILTSTGYSETPDWSPDGSWLVFAHTECPDAECLASGRYRESLWRMDVDGSDQRQIGEPDTWDWEPRVSPDGREVLFNRTDMPNDMWYTLMIRNLGTGEERVVTANDREPEHPEWTRDGRSVIYNTLHRAGETGLFEQIEQVPADDATATPVVLYASDPSLPRLGYKPTFSPDGRDIAFICEGALCRMDADGSNVKQVFIVPGVELNHVAWGVSPGPGGSR